MVKPTIRSTSVVSVSLSAALLLAMGHGARGEGEDNGLALKPPMGWNPWNCYGNKGDGVTEDVVLAAAQTMANSLKSAGYEYINLDCGWSTKQRDPSSGSLLVNRTRFPHGMKWLADHIHALGLKFGMYGALGYRQCCSGSADANATDGSGPGCNKDREHQVCRTKTYYEQDAKLWASWGIDLLKFDGCGGKPPAVKAMREALKKTGRAIVYSVHSSVEEGVFNATLANVWRTGPDIGSSYEQVVDRAMISNNVSAYIPGGPSGWNNPDMLVVGNIGNQNNGGSPPALFPDAEGRTQFALWCLIKAPLLIGTFLHNITEPSSHATFATLTNKAAIAVNQDPLGEQGVLRKDGGYMPNKPRPTTNPAYGFQVWSGALSAGGAAAVLANLEGKKSQKLTLSDDEMPPSRRGSAEVARVWDIVEAFSGAKRTGVTLPATVMVGPHDVAMWVLTPAK